MATGTDSFTLSNAAASSAAFPLKGGNYVFSAVATFGGGTVKLEMLAADGSSFLVVQNIAGTAASLNAAGTICGLVLPAGMYKIVVATATAVYANVAGVLG